MPQKQALRNHQFTQGLTEEQIERLAGIANQVEFEENEVVLVDGARSKSFFLLLTGSVVVGLHTPQCVMAVQALGPGNAFGWSALLDDQHAAQIPGRMIGGKSDLLRHAIGQSEFDYRRQICLPGSKLIFQV